VSSRWAPVIAIPYARFCRMAGGHIGAVPATVAAAGSEACVGREASLLTVRSCEHGDPVKRRPARQSFAHAADGTTMFDAASYSNSEDGRRSVTAGDVAQRRLTRLGRLLPRAS